jgi:hypothetical protein
LIHTITIRRDTIGEVQHISVKDNSKAFYVLKHHAMEMYWSFPHLNLGTRER